MRGSWRICGNFPQMGKIGYDSAERVLFVQFRKSGTIYSYDDVPALVYSDLMNAASMGGYYNEYIKGYYTAHRLTE